MYHYIFLEWVQPQITSRFFDNANALFHMQQTKSRATTVEEERGLLKQILYADTAGLGYITTHCCDSYCPTQARC